MRDEGCPGDYFPLLDDLEGFQWFGHQKNIVETVDFGGSHNTRGIRGDGTLAQGADGAG